MRRVVLPGAVFFLMVLAGCASVPQRRAREPSPQTTPRTTVYVARRGWHIDIGFAVPDLAPPLAILAADFPDPHYVFFGFGDRRYLTSRNKNFPSMLAALWPGAAIVLATALQATPEQAFGAAHVLRLSVSSAQAQEAQLFVWRSLVKEAGAVRAYATGPYEGSLYYSAVLAYSAVHTCNTWVAEALQSMGLPVQSVGVVFAAQLWLQLLRIESAAGERSGASAPQESRQGLLPRAATIRR
jgi:uncharacterized protein (TIGR02117 family)